MLNGLFKLISHYFGTPVLMHGENDETRAYDVIKHTWNFVVEHPHYNRAINCSAMTRSN